jgi:hypothetical protein
MGARLTPYRGRRPAAPPAGGRHRAPAPDDERSAAAVDKPQDLERAQSLMEPPRGDGGLFMGDRAHHAAGATAETARTASHRGP